MKDIDLIQALKRIKVQTGGLICLGCGHEHNCGVHGCAVIREAAQRLEAYRQGKEHIDREAWGKPCKVGDKVFQQNGVDIFESQVKKIICDCAILLLTKKP